MNIALSQSAKIVALDPGCETVTDIASSLSRSRIKPVATSSAANAFTIRIAEDLAIACSRPTAAGEISAVIDCHH